jgi:predicted dienelactone hydrolase
MVAALVLLVLAACTHADSSGAPPSCATRDAPDIDIEGAVAGTRSSTMRYEVPWTRETRELAVHTWYRTDDESGTAARWLDAFIDENSWVDAGWADSSRNCRAPLVVYSHGSQGWAGGGAPILRQLVNAGWVAAAPDHTGNTFVDNVEPRPESYPLFRALDITATIDWIAGLPADDPLYARVDTSRVFLFGHSYGGQTAWIHAGPGFDAELVAAKCAASAVGCTPEEEAAFAAGVADTRITAVAPLDGTLGADFVSDEGWDTLDRPVLFMTASADGSDADAFARASGGDVTWVDLLGACHESFTATTVPCDLDKTEGLTVAATWVADFATVRVRGSDDPAATEVLDGTRSVSDIAVVTRSGEE